MALVFTVPQLLESADGSVPEAFAGTVKSVFKPMKEKPGEKPWTMQKVVITDQGKEIELIFDNRPEVPRSYEGKRIYVTAYRNAKGGFSGVKRKSYKEKPQVAIYEGADVAIEGASGDNHPAQPPPQPAQNEQRQQHRPPATNGREQNGNGHHAPANGAPPPQQTFEKRKAAVEAERFAEMKKFDKRLAKASSALIRCVDSAMSIIDTVNKRHANVIGKPAPELVEKIAMGLLVNACWSSKPADIENFPMKPFHTYEKTENDDGNHPPAKPREGQPFSS